MLIAKEHRERLNHYCMVRKVTQEVAVNEMIAEGLQRIDNDPTIQLDREAIMEQLVASTKTESELLRAEMVTKLEGLVAEVEKHRNSDGKLPFTAIDQILSISKAVIELTGIRKPIVEKFEVRRTPIQFNTVIVPTGGRVFDPKREVLKEPLTLEAGDNNE